MIVRLRVRWDAVIWRVRLVQGRDGYVVCFGNQSLVISMSGGM